MGSSKNPVILTYHSVSEGNSPLKISPELFVQQMQWLQGNVRVVELSEVVDTLAGGRPLPERAVVLTFDDGFCDFYLSAAPVLRRLGLPGYHFSARELLRKDKQLAGAAKLGGKAKVAQLGTGS